MGYTYWGDIYTCGVYTTSWVLLLFSIEGVYIFRGIPVGCIYLWGIHTCYIYILVGYIYSLGLIPFLYIYSRGTPTCGVYICGVYILLSYLYPCGVYTLAGFNICSVYIYLKSTPTCGIYIHMGQHFPQARMQHLFHSMKWRYKMHCIIAPGNIGY
jgi:hypothetical protein